MAPLRVQSRFVVAARRRAVDKHAVVEISQIGILALKSSDVAGGEVARSRDGDRRGRRRAAAVVRWIAAMPLCLQCVEVVSVGAIDIGGIDEAVSDPWLWTRRTFRQALQSGWTSRTSLQKPS